MSKESRENERFVSIKISAMCERYMTGTIDKDFLNSCIKENDMTALRIEVEKQDVNHTIDEAWMSVDSLNVEEITATIFKDTI